MKYLLAAAALMFAVIPNLQASESLAEPVPVAYVSVPFGNSAKASPSYGLRLERMESDVQQSPVLFDATRRAYLDVKFSEEGLTGLSLNGTDFVALAKLHGYNANGSSSLPQWWSGLSATEKAMFAVAGIAAVGCAADWCQHDEEEERKCYSAYLSDSGVLYARSLPDCSTKFSVKD